MNVVAENTKAIIDEKGLKHSAIAKKAGYSRQQFSYMLHGRKTITPSDVLRIANALEVTPNDLFGLKPKDDEKGE